MTSGTETPEASTAMTEQVFEAPELMLDDPKTIWTRWNGGSIEKLIDAEKRLLSSVSAFINRQMVNVRHYNSQVYTLTAKNAATDDTHPVPFVLIHGFAAGVAIWKSNIASLAEKRTVHAFDVLGFGRSSRPPFPVEATLAELELVQSIEDWRREMKIDKMILVGHSFGGYLAAAYTLEHPSHVRHLVLVDPWGFSERPTAAQLVVPIWMRAVGTILSRFNPLASLRAAGPFGPLLVRKLRADLGVRYSQHDPNAIYDYIYQCNVREPSGEIAFRTLTRGFGWPKRPMGKRFSGIDERVPVTFVCGSKSWVNKESIYEIQNEREDSYVKVKIVNGAGHHVYADQPEEFNRILCEVSSLVDADGDLEPVPKSDDEHEEH